MIENLGADTYSVILSTMECTDTLTFEIENFFPYDCEDECINDADGDEVCDEFDLCPNDPDNDQDGDGFCIDEEISAVQIK